MCKRSRKFACFFSHFRVTSNIIEKDRIDVLITNKQIRMTCVLIVQEIFNAVVSQFLTLVENELIIKYFITGLSNQTVRSDIYPLYLCEFLRNICVFLQYNALQHDLSIK